MNTDEDLTNSKKKLTLGNHKKSCKVCSDALSPKAARETYGKNLCSTGSDLFEEALAQERLRNTDVDNNPCLCAWGLHLTHCMPCRWSIRARFIGCEDIENERNIAINHMCDDGQILYLNFIRENREKELTWETELRKKITEKRK